MKNFLLFFSTVFLFVACSEDGQIIPDENTGLYFSQTELSVLNTLEQSRPDLRNCTLFRYYVHGQENGALLKQKGFSAFATEILSSGKIYYVKGPLVGVNNRNLQGTVSRSLGVSFELPGSLVETHKDFTLSFEETEDLLQVMQFSAYNISSGTNEQVYDTFFKISKEEYSHFNELLNSVCSAD